VNINEQRIDKDVRAVNEVYAALLGYTGLGQSWIPLFKDTIDL